MKNIIGIYTSPRGHWVGDGFPVRTLFSYDNLGKHISPFLLLDYAVANVWHALNPVNTRFKFHFGIYIFALNGRDNLFVTSCGTVGEVHDLERPTHFLRVTLVHAEDVSGKYGGLITTCSSANLEDTVLGIVRVAGD